MPYIIIIIFVLTYLLQACRDWIVLYKWLSTISVFSLVVPDFPFFQVTFDYLTLCFPVEILSTSSTPLHSFSMTKPLQSSILYTDPCAVQFWSIPKFLGRIHNLRHDISHPPNHPYIIFFSLITSSSINSQAPC